MSDGNGHDRLPERLLLPGTHLDGTDTTTGIYEVQDVHLVDPRPRQSGRGARYPLGLLLDAASYLRRAIDGDVTRLTGLSGHWFETLLRLKQSDPGGVRMNDMAAQVSLPPSGFSRLADKWELANNDLS